MAIIANSQITLSVVVDIKATWRFYLLQSSSLNPPSKPSTYPPASAWNNTEPSYTDGSTNSLYIVDCTVFGDDTFQYSEVSLSSSYEAAKAAYNKATNAQTSANEAQEGVDNVNEKVNSADDTATEAKDRVTEAERLITLLEETLAALVQGKDGESLMVQQDGKWAFSLAEVIEALEKAGSDINTLQGSNDNLNGLILNLQSAVDDLGVMADYIVVKSYNGQPCIELGEKENDFKVRITNTEIQFADGTTIPAYISNKKLMIEQAEVKNELQFGGFVWKVGENGGMGLVWKGADA